MDGNKPGWWSGMWDVGCPQESPRAWRAAACRATKSIGRPRHEVVLIRMSVQSHRHSTRRGAGDTGQETQCYNNPLEPIRELAAGGGSRGDSLEAGNLCRSLAWLCLRIPRLLLS